MPALALNHFTVLAQDLDTSRDFYREVLGLAEGPRPDFGFPGAWLYIGDAAVLHIVAGRALPAQPHGVIDHVAFSARDLAGTLRRLEARGVGHDLRRLPGAGGLQLFFFDPDGARVELDFAADEQPA